MCNDGVEDSVCRKFCAPEVSGSWHSKKYNSWWERFNLRVLNNLPINLSNNLLNLPIFFWSGVSASAELQDNTLSCARAKSSRVDLETARLGMMCIWGVEKGCRVTPSWTLFSAVRFWGPGCSPARHVSPFHQLTLGFVLGFLLDWRIVSFLWKWSYLCFFWADSKLHPTLHG